MLLCACLLCTVLLWIDDAAMSFLPRKTIVYTEERWWNRNREEMNISIVNGYSIIMQVLLNRFFVNLSLAVYIRYLLVTVVL